VGPPIFFKEEKPDAGNTKTTGATRRIYFKRVHTERLHSFSLCAVKTLKISDMVGIINKISPQFLAESWDNPGLQVGDPKGEVSRIMIALDASQLTVAEAISSKCQLLITHHPLIFKPLKSISAETPTGSSVYSAVKNDLSIVSMHTNYDVACDGLNDELAVRLGLCDFVPLQSQTLQQLVKLVVLVPVDHLERVREAMFAHAESLGDYKECSFSAAGEGTFTPLPGANPFIGNVGQREKVDEFRLELLLTRENVARAVKTLMAVHPYEEPAFDLYPLLNEGKTYGLGRVGKIASPTPLRVFVEQMAARLGCPKLRFVGNPAALIGKVAVCGGSGASLMRAAVRSGADVLVTGDVKYHDARDAQELGIALVDAGHFFTEKIMVEAVARRLEKSLAASGMNGIEVLRCAVEADPFQYFQ